MSDLIFHLKRRAYQLRYFVYFMAVAFFVLCIAALAYGIWDEAVRAAIYSFCHALLYSKCKKWKAKP